MINKYLLNKRKEEQYLESSEILELEGDPEVFLPYLASNVEQTSTDNIIGREPSLYDWNMSDTFPATHEIVHSWAQTLPLCNSHRMARSGPL